MSGVLPICDAGTTSRVLLPSRLWGRGWNRRKTKLRLPFDAPFLHPRRWAAGTLQGKGTERNQSGRAGKRKTLQEQTERVSIRKPERQVQLGSEGSLRSPAAPSATLLSATHTRSPLRAGGVCPANAEGGGIV